jgi:hypothetical protein
VEVLLDQEVKGRVRLDCYAIPGDKTHSNCNAGYNTLDTAADLHYDYSHHSQCFVQN